MAADQLSKREEVVGPVVVTGEQLHDQLFQLFHVGEAVNEELRGCQVGHLGGG